MAQLEQIEAIEKRLWNAADTLRTNSNYASNEYFMPVMGLIFLRHAYSRYLKVKEEIIPNLPSRGGKTRELSKGDFSNKGALYLQPEAQFDYLVALTDADDRADKIMRAMELIEADYETLQGQLPKGEYQDLDNEVLGQLLRTLNPEELKQASGDIFGRIYEYFLTGFADLKAHDGGEFFTPVSLVQLIVNVIEPDHGKVLDPACGSGGMFVQSAHFVEQLQKNPNETLTFYGMEKNPTTIRLAKMNLAVHGLVGNIQKAISYYEDPHPDLWSNADFVMANPPFNTDEVDADKIKNDPRLPFGLPGENKKGKVPNGNYLWIQYFYSYLNATGRAGFVMSSQASSAGREEAKVREQLVKTGHVEMMIDIRGNFFYTRSVPCQLWFFNKAKPKNLRNKVLMIDARNVYRKVTRKIMDFSPEQLHNLSAIVWLYRGQTERFIELVRSYVEKVLAEALACQLSKDEDVMTVPDFIAIMGALQQSMQPFLVHLDKELGEAAPHAELYREWQSVCEQVDQAWKTFVKATADADKYWHKYDYDSAADLTEFIETEGFVVNLAEQSRDLLRDIDLAYKLATRLIDYCEQEQNAKDSELWDAAVINSTRKTSLRKTADNARKGAVEQLKLVRYFYKQAHWLLSRFPNGELADVAGLVKLVDVSEIAAADWSLTPGRYVGVAPEEVDEDFDFEEALRDIHIELKGLNEEAADLAAQIALNFEELGI